MSKIVTLLEEVKTRLTNIRTPVDARGRVVVCYDDDDLLNQLKGLKSPPGWGIVYEGMRSMPEPGQTMKVGISCEAVVSIIIVQADDAIRNADAKKTIAIDLLQASRDQFLGQRSTTTGHLWHYLVESPALTKNGMVFWVMRWSVPIQMQPAKLTP